MKTSFGKLRNRAFNKRFILMLLVMLIPMLTGVAMAQTPQYKYYKYNSTDGGIYEKISADGKWALVNLGMTQGGSGDACPSKIVNTATGEMFPVSFNGAKLNIRDISNEDSDGRITVVGSLYGRPMSYYFDPKNPTTPGTITIYVLTQNWSSGVLESITPDGEYAVGYQKGYSGNDLSDSDLDGEFLFHSLYVEIGTETPVATPGAPKYDRNGNDQHVIRFSDISADGRYILGEREWFMPTEGYPFIYDTQTNTYNAIGFTTDDNCQIAQQSIDVIQDPVMSTNGRYVAALAALASEDDPLLHDNYPCRYDTQTGELTIFKDPESADIAPSCIDDNGTIFGFPDIGGPIGNFKIFYQDKYWISFFQICQQIYGFDFSQKLGYEFTGTPTSMTADGTAFVGYSDPLGESYYFNLGTTVEEACSGIDLFDSYTVTPESGSIFSAFKSIEISFDHLVQVVGRGDTHLHLYKKGKDGAADTKVCDGLSGVGENSGLHLKSNSNKTVVATVQEVEMEYDVEYYFVLDPGAVAVASDITITNRLPIKATYHNHRHTFNNADDVCDKCGHGFFRYEANDKVEPISPDAFKDSEGETVEILNNSFDNGYGVMELDRPAVRIISYGFYGVGLTAVTIGKSITNIEECAFADCGEITKYTLNCQPTCSIAEDALTGVSDFKIVVPALTTHSWTSNSIWASYGSHFTEPDFTLNANKDPSTPSTGYYTTFYNSYYAYTLPSGVKAYTAQIIDEQGENVVKLTAINGNILPKGIAVLLHSTSTGEMMMTISEENGNEPATNMFNGVDADTDQGDSRNYMLSYGQYGLGFYLMKEDMKLSANKAFQPQSAPMAQARALRMVFADDEVTGIEDPLLSPLKGEDAIYNLNGMRLNQLQKGINIVNGKKVIK